MAHNVRVNGTWRNTVMPYTKVAGVWKPAKAVYNKVNGSWKSSFLQGGVNDFGFIDYDRHSGSPTGGVRSIFILPNRELLIGGEFTTFNGVAGRFIKTDSNIVTDRPFAINLGLGPGANGLWNDSVSVQSNGQIVIGGSFSTWNGVTVGRIVRLNADGTRDTAFTTNTGTGADSLVRATRVQSDQKIIVVGQFTIWNNVTVGRIIRLNADGTRDTTFTNNMGTAANGGIADARIQSNGQIVVAGGFTTWNGVTVNGIVRLNADGTQDTTFTTNTGTAGTGTESIAIQSNGQILLVGGFTTWNGVTVNRIVRLNADGTRDTSFNTNTGTAASTFLNVVVVQPNGQILVGGSMTSWNGTAVGRIVRLNADGTRDATFTTNNNGGAETNTVDTIAVDPVNNDILVGGFFSTWGGINTLRFAILRQDGTFNTDRLTSGASGTSTNSNGVRGLAEQPNGQILVGGNFTRWNRTTVVNGIARLSSDGVLDTEFNTKTGTASGGGINAMEIQPDGKILVAGSFTTWNGATVGRIVRLNADGTRDTAFTTNTGTGANTTINSVAIQTDGKIVIGGQFETWNGVTVNRIVRLNADGTRDTAFTTNTGTGTGGAGIPSISAIAIQNNNQILLGGSFTTFNGATVNRIIRLNADGTRDTAFTANVGSGPNDAVLSISIQSNGQILVAGVFTTWQVSNNTGRIVRLNADGTRDTAFTTNTGTGANSIINAVAIQSNGQIVLAGNFTTWNGVTVNGIVRLNENGTIDTAFTTNTGLGIFSVLKIIIQRDRKILIGGDFNVFNRINRSGIVRIGGENAL
jgi:uncharacterized delta-60 repeat protein